MENKNIPVVLRIPTTKAGITAAAKHAIEMVNEGEVSAVEAYIKLKALQQYCAEVEKGIKAAFVAEVDNTINVKIDRPLGATLKEITTPAKYDYSGDAEWVSQSLEVEKAKEDLKHIEKKFKLDGKAVMIGGGDVTYSVTLNN